MNNRILKTFVIACTLSAPASAEPIAKELFAAKKTPSPESSAPIGSYARGCLAGASELPETGPTLAGDEAVTKQELGPSGTDRYDQEADTIRRDAGWMGGTICR